MSRNIGLVYTDLETTGLDVAKSQIYEIAMIAEIHYDDGCSPDIVWEYETFVRLDGDEPVSNWTLNSANYKRYLFKSEPWMVASPLTAAIYIGESLRSLKRQHSVAEWYMVGANPKFDQELLERFLMGRAAISSPFKHRAINIEERVAQKLKLIEPPGLKEAYNLMGLTEPFESHTAMGDCEAARQIMHKLIREY